MTEEGKTGGLGGWRGFQRRGYVFMDGKDSLGLGAGLLKLADGNDLHGWRPGEDAHGL